MHLTYREVTQEDFTHSKLARFILPEPDYEEECYKTRLGYCSQKQKVGEGTFGQVYKMDYNNSLTEKKAVIAMKKYSNKNPEGFPITSLREILILQQLSHKNVIKAKDMFFSRQSPENEGRGSFYLQMDYCEHDLQGLLGKKLKFDIPQLKCIMSQVLSSLAYLHQNNIIHRDIKGANILIRKDGVVKLTDFGLARQIYPEQPKLNYTRKVVTLWYRAPEILLGIRHYDSKVDIWSLGVFFYELVFKQVMF